MLIENKLGNVGKHYGKVGKQLKIRKLYHNRHGYTCTEAQMPIPTYGCGDILLYGSAYGFIRISAYVYLYLKMFLHPCLHRYDHRYPYPYIGVYRWFCNRDCRLSADKGR